VATRWQRVTDRAYLWTAGVEDIFASLLEAGAWRVQQAASAFVASHRRKRHRVFSVTRRRG